MTKRKFYLLIFPAIALASLFFSKTTHALVARRTVRVTTVPQNRIIDKDFYLAGGESVEISGKVLGDALVAGGLVVIDGEVTGDVLALGGNVIIAGVVEKDLRILGGDVIVNGKIGGNISIAAGNVVLGKDADIGGGVVLAGGTVILQSPVRSDIAVFAGNTEISNEIEGSADIFSGNLTIAGGAAIKGDLIYTSQSEAAISESASISGRILRKTTPAIGITKDEISEKIADFRLVLQISEFLISLLIGVLVLKFLPNYSQKNSDVINKEPLKCFSLGIVILILAPLFGFLLLLVIIGIPIFIVLAVLFAVILYTSKIFFSYWLGFKLTKKIGYTNKYLAFSVGLIAFYALSLIQPLGFFVTLLFMLIGTGAQYIVFSQIYRKLVKSKII